jgi:hypothetical protein
MPDDTASQSTSQLIAVGRFQLWALLMCERDLHRRLMGLWNAGFCGRALAGRWEK